MNIKEIAEKFINAENQAFQEGKFDALEKVESPDIVIHMPPAPDFIGYEAHKQHIISTRDTSSGLKQDWEYITGDGSVCAISLKQTVKLEVDNPIFKIPAGSTIEADGVFIMRTENDRIAEIWIKTSITIR